MSVQYVGNCASVGDNSGHIRGSGKRSDLQRTVGKPSQFGVQMIQINMTIGVLGDHHNIGDGFAPRKLVGVMLKRPDKYHRPLPRRNQVKEVVAIIQVRRYSQVQNTNEFVYRSGRAGASEDHACLVVAVNSVVNDRPSVFAKASGLQAGAGGLGVGIGVPRKHLFNDEAFEKRQRPT